MRDTKTLTEKTTFTVTLDGGRTHDGESRREIKAAGILWAVTLMQNKITTWHDNTVKVIAVREGNMFTADEMEELDRDKAEHRCR